MIPQTGVRVVPASQRLRDAIVEGRLTLPNDQKLITQHAARAVMRHSGAAGGSIAPPASRMTPSTASSR